MRRLRDQEVPDWGVNFNGPATAAKQQTTAACLHTRSLPAASTRRGVAGSTSAEYESERKEKTNRRRTNHTKSGGAWRGNDRSQQ